jgi:hypothetical protein
METAEARPDLPGAILDAVALCLILAVLYVATVAFAAVIGG